MIRKNPCRPLEQWRMALFDLMRNPSQKPPPEFKTPKSGNLQNLLEDLVYSVRRNSGEVLALRNAYVLLECFRLDPNNHFDSKDQKLNFLLAFEAAIDLAAQLDDWLLLVQLRSNLESYKPIFSDQSTLPILFERFVAYCRVQEICCTPRSKTVAVQRLELKELLDGYATIHVHSGIA